MRRWLIFIFLADLAAMPFLVGAFAGGGSNGQTSDPSPRVMSTETLPMLDPCVLLGSSDTEYQVIVDHYSDIQQASDAFGLESAPDC